MQELLELLYIQLYIKFSLNRSKVSYDDNNKRTRFRNIQNYYSFCLLPFLNFNAEKMKRNETALSKKINYVRCSSCTKVGQ